MQDLELRHLTRTLCLRHGRELMWTQSGIDEIEFGRGDVVISCSGDDGADAALEFHWSTRFEVDEEGLCDVWLLNSTQRSGRDALA